MSLSTTAESDGLLKDLDPIQRRLLEENCILVDDYDRRIGHIPKKECHLISNIQKGMLHRAFSVFLFNTDGKLLLQQRSMAKITFPGYFTNTCCSHPLHTASELEEKDAIGVKRAALRKLQHEMGMSPEQIQVEDFHYITRIRYQAPSDDTWGENEIDYCLILQKDVDIHVNENEVMSCRYVDKKELKDLIRQSREGSVKLTPWFKMIGEDLLWKWWDTLDSLNKVTDRNTIHKLS